MLLAGFTACAERHQAVCAWRFISEAVVDADGSEGTDGGVAEMAGHSSQPQINISTTVT